MLYTAPGSWMKLWMTSSLTGRHPITSLNAAVEQDAEKAKYLATINPVFEKDNKKLPTY